jgi:hypothetical protein
VGQAANLSEVRQIAKPPHIDLCRSSRNPSPYTPKKADPILKGTVKSLVIW